MPNLRRHLRLIALTAVAVLLAACVPIPPAAPLPASSAPSSAATPVTDRAKSAAVEYDLGETTITQARFPEGSRFRNMPVRLNGLIAVPDGEGPFPVIVILHGTHPGCPEIDHVDRWPCDPAVEQPNYRGFGYLAEDLAAHGYVALSININAENTFGFGEPVPGERLTQIVDKHLRALAAAATGGENKFGVDLKWKADLRRLGFAGHSRGGDLAVMLTAGPDMAAAAASPDGYGPVAGVLMIAPSPGFADPAKGSPVPLGIILPMCDADVINQEGQHFYEGARLAAGQQAWVTSAFLDAASHNYFNSTLGHDPFGRFKRPDCETRLDAQAQQMFLGDYAVDFFESVFGDAAAARAAKARLGMDPATAAPPELYGLGARVAVLPAAAKRTAVFTPASAEELTTNRLGGAVQAQGVTTFFCEAGHYAPTTRPGTEPCRRANLVIPGDPALAVVSWEKPGASLRFEIPEGKGDLSLATSAEGAISVRAAVDPLSKLNAVGQAQGFSLRVTDGAGKTAAVATRSDEPALRYPAGEVVEDATFGDMFTGRLPLTAVRVSLSALQGVDWTDIREVALVFDRASSGSLFLADLEWVHAGK
ncbi:MAG: alpha/beta hydrolase family protein [Nitrososphaerales archaeon]